MQTLKHQVLFQVSLSNGQSFYEGKGDYKDIPGLPSAWQRLQKYLVDNRLEITSLGLYTKDSQTFNLPSLGKNPKFQQFQLAEKPLDYNMFRAIGREMDIVPQDKGYQVKNTVISDWFTVAEAVYPDYKLQVWVDETNPKNSWVLVVKI